MISATAPRSKRLSIIGGRDRVAVVCHAEFTWIGLPAKRDLPKKQGKDIRVTVPTNTFSDAQREIYRLRNSRVKTIGWSPRLRQRFGYYTPDECYEAVMLNSSTVEQTG